MINVVVICQEFGKNEYQSKAMKKKKHGEFLSKLICFINTFMLLLDLFII